MYFDRLNNIASVLLFAWANRCCWEEAFGAGGGARTLITMMSEWDKPRQEDNPAETTDREWLWQLWYLGSQHCDSPGDDLALADGGGSFGSWEDWVVLVGGLVCEEECQRNPKFREENQLRNQKVECAASLLLHTAPFKLQHIKLGHHNLPTLKQVDAHTSEKCQAETEEEGPLFAKEAVDLRADGYRD